MGQHEAKAVSGQQALRSRHDLFPTRSTVSSSRSILVLGGAIGRTLAPSAITKTSVCPPIEMTLPGYDPKTTLPIF
jgi:hypothetical protein